MRQFGCFLLLMLLTTRAHGQTPNVGLRLQLLDASEVILTRADLDALPQDSATVRSHSKVNAVRGPSLIAVLERAGLAEVRGLKGVQLLRVVVAEGADGYRVAFGAADLDPTLGASRVLLVLTEDGAPVATPRLAVPDDQRGARSVRDLVRVVVRVVP